MRGEVLGKGGVTTKDRRPYLNWNRIGCPQMFIPGLFNLFCPLNSRRYIFFHLLACSENMRDSTNIY